MKNRQTYGTDRIERERWLQLEALGWTVEHDSKHTDEELVLMALARLVDQKERGRPVRRIEQLVKAGALIAAEIDRLHKEIQNKAMLAAEHYYEPEPRNPLRN